MVEVPVRVPLTIILAPGIGSPCESVTITTDTVFTLLFSNDNNTVFHHIVKPLRIQH